MCTHNKDAKRDKKATLISELFMKHEAPAVAAIPRTFHIGNEALC